MDRALKNEAECALGDLPRMLGVCEKITALPRATPPQASAARTAKTAIRSLMRYHHPSGMQIEVARRRYEKLVATL
jgi:hypothetical protein